MITQDLSQQLEQNLSEVGKTDSPRGQKTDFSEIVAADGVDCTLLRPGTRRIQANLLACVFRFSRESARRNTTLGVSALASP
jgi:hypothetical protein